MPTAGTNCLKPKFTLVTSSAAIAIITRLQGGTRHLKIGHTVFVRYDSFKNYSTEIGNYYCQSKNWTFFATQYKISHEKGSWSSFYKVV